jgi:propionyl-CoA synthetase
VRILKSESEHADPEELGRIVIKMPLPPGTILTLWENDDLFNNLYFKQFPGFYDTMDVGHKCENSFITVRSRADDVINVAGHRIAASSIEEVEHFSS